MSDLTSERLDNDTVVVACVSCGWRRVVTFADWYNQGAIMHPTCQISPQDLYEEWAKYLSAPPISRRDRRAAIKEAEAILHLNSPLAVHKYNGCHCKECEEKFFTEYLQYLDQEEGKTNAV